MTANGLFTVPFDVMPPPELPDRVTPPPELISTNLETVPLRFTVPVVVWAIAAAVRIMPSIAA